MTARPCWPLAGGDVAAVLEAGDVIVTCTSAKLPFPSRQLVRVTALQRDEAGASSA
jgi:hypothetical protein